MRLRNLGWGLVAVAVASFVACSGADVGTLTGGGGPPAPTNGGQPSHDAGAGHDSNAPPGPVHQDSGSSSPDAGSTTPDSGTTPPPDASKPPPPDAAPPDGFDQFQHHNLDVVNGYRATKGIAPLVLDKQLSTFALAGTQELSQDHQPHQHFINASNDGSLWTSGFHNSAAENQGDPNGWFVMSQDPTQNELMQIDDIQKAMFAEGPGGGHYDNIMNPQLTRLGVGLLEIQGQLYLTNDFSQ